MPMASGVPSELESARLGWAMEWVGRSQGWRGCRTALYLAVALTAGWQLHSEDSPKSSDVEYRQRILGTWQDEYQGKRTMTVRVDGTATMLVQLHGWKAALYASSLRFEMTWSIENGQFKKRTTGGEPAGKVKAVLKMMGDHTSERILELTPKRLRLLDQNGKRQYDWRRVPS